MPSACRDLWDYIIDYCEAYGIWRVNLELAQLVINAKVPEEEILEHFSDRVIGIDVDKWFIPGFVTFQYGKLKPDSKPHQSVIKNLTENGVDPVTLTLKSKSPYPLINSPKGIHTLKEKEKDKAKAKDQEKDQDRELDISDLFPKGFDETPEGREAYVDLLHKINKLKKSSKTSEGVTP
jgi:hypothetical protein